MRKKSTRVYPIYNKDIREKIANSYINGSSLRDILKEFKTSWTTIWEILDEYKISRRNAKEAHGTTPDFEEKICELYKKGLSCKKVAKLLNSTASTVFKILKRNDKNIRSMSEASKIYSCDDNYFKNIDSKDKAYFLGLLISDGNVTNRNVSIALQIKDKYILELFKTYIKHTGNLLFNKRKYEHWSDMSKLSIYSLNLVKDLEKLGVIPKKAYFTYFPPIPEEFYSHFIRDVFDGDGCITGNKENQFTFSIAGTDTILSKIQEILMEKCDLKKTKIKLHIKTSIMTYGGNKQVNKIYNWIYQDCDDLYFNRKTK